MRIKLISLFCVTLALTACMDRTSKTDKKKEDGPQPTVKPKPDFQKAALLNIEMGQTYLAQGNVSRAKKKFVHALELKPKLPEAHSAIGYFYETVGDMSEAEEHHLEAIRYGAGKGRFYNNYGTFLCRQDRLQEADRVFNKALKDKQYIKTAEVYENAGICALKQPDIAKAYNYLLTAIQHDPSRSAASLELANIELEKNNLQGCAQYLNLFKQSGAPSAKSLWLSIRLNKQMGNQNELASAALQLKNLFPNSVEYKKYLEFTQHD